MEEHGRKLAGENKTNENVTIARNVAEDVALIILNFSKWKRRLFR